MQTLLLNKSWYCQVLSSMTCLAIMLNISNFESKYTFPRSLWGGMLKRNGGLNIEVSTRKPTVISNRGYNGV